jgi:hypothetical protein
LLGWCFQECQVFLLLSSFEMYYSLHYKLHVATFGRGQNTRTYDCYGLERPRGSLWPRSRGQRWGRSSPVRAFPAPKPLRRAQRNLSALQHFGSPTG